MHFQGSSRWDFDDDDDWGDRRRSVSHRGQKFEPKATQGNPLYGKVRSYRGIPDSVDDTLQKIATDIKVPVGEVVRAFLERAIAEYNNGDLTPTPTPRVIRSHRTNTLYPRR